ncbi:MAG: glycosyl transferase group 1 [Myxococcales bacterium]|nr:glycosyl transferase group 1 [Myxococcales bacterium]
MSVSTEFPVSSAASSPRRIRLAHVCSSDLAFPALMPFCRPLLARGWEITLITPDGPHVAAGRMAGIRWLPLALQRKLHTSSDVVGTLQLARYFLQGQYDIVHTHNIKVGHVARVVAAMTRVPIIVHTIHGMAYSLDTPWLKRIGHATLEKIASFGCDIVMSQSREDRDTYLATKVIAADKLVLIGNGIDLSRFDPASPTGSAANRAAVRQALGLEGDEILFFSAGRLIVEKGFVELFEATRIARRQDPRIRLAIAGSTDQRVDTLSPEILDKARDEGVLLLGRRVDMPDLYAASDVVTLPSWHEGLPRVLMEGAAMGRPLLATDVCGCREIVVPPNNGLLVPVRDARALAAAMNTLASDEALRARLGRDNALQARDLYAIERSVALVNEVYDRLLAREGLA